MATAACPKCGHVHVTPTLCLFRVSGSGLSAELCGCYGEPKPPPEIRVGQSWRDTRHPRRSADLRVVAYTPGEKTVRVQRFMYNAHTVQVATLRKHFRLIHAPLPPMTETPDE